MKQRNLEGKLQGTPGWRWYIWKVIITSSAWLLCIDWHDALALETLLTELRKYREKKQENE